jgi:cell division protein FtsX
MTNNFLGRLIKQTLTYAVIGYVMGMILITLMTSYASASQVSRLNGALGIIGLSVDILPIIFAIVLYIGATIQVVGEWREYKQLQLEIKKSSNELAEIENQLLKG